MHQVETPGPSWPVKYLYFITVFSLELLLLYTAIVTGNYCKHINFILTACDLKTNQLLFLGKGQMLLFGNRNYNYVSWSRP